MLQHKLAQKQEDTALALYNENFDNGLFSRAIVDKDSRYANSLINEALAICGSPYCKLSGRRWGKDAREFLKSFGNNARARQREGTLAWENALWDYFKIEGNFTLDALVSFNLDELSKYCGDVITRRVQQGDGLPPKDANNMFPTSRVAANALRIAAFRRLYKGEPVEDWRAQLWAWFKSWCEDWTFGHITSTTKEVLTEECARILTTRAVVSGQRPPKDPFGYEPNATVCAKELRIYARAQVSG